MTEKLSDKLQEYANQLDWRLYSRIEEVKIFANRAEALESENQKLKDLNEKNSNSFIVWMNKAREYQSKLIDAESKLTEAEKKCESCLWNPKRYMITEGKPPNPCEDLGSDQCDPAICDWWIDCKLRDTRKVDDEK